MRPPVTAERVRRFMEVLGRESRQAARVWLVGGASAVLVGWRVSTIDIDLKIVPDVEAGRTLPAVKADLDVNVELASPDQFLPPLPGWEERSVPIGREGPIMFFHYDFVAQALAKVERGFARDLEDVREMVRRGLVVPAEALRLHAAIEPELGRYPALDPATLRRAVRDAFGSGR
jgi:hypothetical protein